MHFFQHTQFREHNLSVEREKTKENSSDVMEFILFRYFYLTFRTQFSLYRYLPVFICFYSFFFVLKKGSLNIYLPQMLFTDVDEKKKSLIIESPFMFHVG